LPLVFRVELTVVTLPLLPTFITLIYG